MFKRAAIFFLIAALPLFAHAYTSPGKPTGFVNDFAGMLTGEERVMLESKLAAFEKETSNELAVVTIPNLGGDTVENYAVKLFEEWKIGKAKKDNGVLLLVSRDDRKVRIEVGYGLEGALTDAQSYWIIHDVITPNFKEGKYYAGLDGAATNIIAATRGEYVPSSSPQKEATTSLFLEYWYFIPLAFMWLASILGRSKSWWMGGVAGGIAGIVVGVIYGFLFSGIVAIAALIPLGLLFDFVVSRSYNRYATGGGPIPWWIGGGRNGPGSGGSFGGFGGFGGGRSGGGGSSGNW